MSYKTTSIRNVIEDVEGSKVYLPAIQRKFVWPRWKIEHLFDSLMRNYPIGSFLFWELNKEKADEYVFYHFLREYDERKPNNERKKGSFLKDITGVLDGQQRLSSLYLGLQGSHRERLKYHQANKDYAYPETFLYLNLLSLPYVKLKDSIDIDREENFEFRFLTEADAKNVKRKNEKNQEECCYWFKIGTVLKWDKEDPDVDTKFDFIREEIKDENQLAVLDSEKQFVKKAIRDLHKRTVDPLINYFPVTKDDLDDILEIFIRVNSGGTILSKTDLLFSTIVATWENGRDEIEAFLKSLNEIGDGFSFNNDFLMRSCLVLSDFPVLFKVNSFKSENVQIIKDNWPDVKTALEKSVELIASFGFSGQLLTSQNAVVVIAYHFMKGGSESNDSKEGLRKYLLHALLKNVYGGQGDQVITSFRNILRTKNPKETNEFNLISKEFDFNSFLNLKLPANKTLKISQDDIEDFLGYKKGATSFFVLTLLYPNLKYSEVHFHQDHIHPDTRFTNAKMKDVGIAEEKWASWQELKDTIPNLQLMERRQNSSKNATLFTEWVISKDGKGKPNVSDLTKFCKDNYIVESEDFDFKNFRSFYDERKDLIRAELISVLNV